MQTTILFVALILNTTFLFIEPLANLVQGINPWVLASSEVALLLTFFAHKILKEFRETFDIDIDNLKIFHF